MLNPLNKAQKEVLEKAGRFSVFLEGPASTGKTTVGVAHLLNLMNAGVSAANILILLPQRTLGIPYYDALKSQDFQAGSIPQIMTFGGLARRMVALFWPLIANKAGFANPALQPKFLTLETAQYYAAKLIKPLLDERGFFSTITINRNRLYSQILDNLNKSAAAGIPCTKMGDRLKDAWVGKPDQIRVYEETQYCIELFRSYCLTNNLLDYSLQIETFVRYLLPLESFRDYFRSQVQFLIYDNIEEDVPIAHDTVIDWLPDLESYLLIFDQEAGYRLFLGADPESGYRLRNFCQENVQLSDSFVQSKEIIHLQDNLSKAIAKKPIKPSRDLLDQSIRVSSKKYYPEMVEWLSKEVLELIDKGVNPGNISIITPFLSDSLRFEFAIRFNELSVPYLTHRPSRSLQEEPATGCLLTLMKIIHPEWEMLPTRFEFRNMLMQAITGFDLIRADVLAKIVYRPQKQEINLGSFDDILPSTQERITYSIGERYEVLRNFIMQKQESLQSNLDIELSILFSELLSLPGFGFHENLDAAETVSRLIDSFIKFRSSYTWDDNQNHASLSRDYIEMIQQGIIAAQYVETWEVPGKESVFLSPAHTFLMANQPVDYQFWLDIGSLGWWERLNQPLTHPYVLSRTWIPGDKWTDRDEYESNQNSLHRLIRGLLYRCRKQVTLCIVEINEQGNEQRGPLLRSTQTLVRAMVHDLESGENGPV